MASWREIENFRRDAKGARALAKRLLDHFAADLTEWEIAFLEGLALKSGAIEISTRQSEKLLQIRDDLQTVETIHGGFSVRTLLTRCFEGRNDLSEDDETWIVALRASSESVIKRKHTGRLMRCARELGFVETEFA